MASEDPDRNGAADTGAACESPEAAVLEASSGSIHDACAAAPTEGSDKVWRSMRTLS